MQNIDFNNKTVLVTGAAGFIGANLITELLTRYPDVTVVGLDVMNDYYDPALKEYRLSEIEKLNTKRFTFVKGNLADKALVDSLFSTYYFDVVVNFASRAGVRYSINHPDVCSTLNLT